MLSLAVRVPARAAIAGLATSAVLLFYWFAGEDVSRTWGWGSGGTIVIRLATAGLVAIWIWRFNRR